MGSSTTIEERIEEIEERNKAMQKKDIEESRTDIVVGGFGFIVGMVGAILQFIVSVVVYIQDNGVENTLSLVGAIVILVFTIFGLLRQVNPITICVENLRHFNAKEEKTTEANGDAAAHA